MAVVVLERCTCIEVKIKTEKSARCRERAIIEREPLLEVRLCTHCKSCFSFSLFIKSFPILKILVIFSDGNTVDDNGDIMDTFMLEKTAKLLRVNNNIKIAGALIPSTEKAPRIQELKGIVTEPDDAIVADFSAYLDKIADFLATRIKRYVCYDSKNLSFIQRELYFFITV